MNDDYLKSDEHKKKMEELAQRCAEFMREFASPDPYQKGFKDGWEAAKKEFQKDSTYVPDTTKQGPIKTMDIMWPDRMPTTSPFPPSYYVNRCGTCNMEFKGVMGYVCNHPNCPTRVTCGTADNNTAWQSSPNINLLKPSTIQPLTSKEVEKLTGKKDE